MDNQETMNTLDADSPVRPFAHSPTRRFPGSPILRIGMGEGVIARAPHIVSALGLGSCVAITLYDTQRKIGGLAHIMLPGSSLIDNRQLTIDNSRYRRADTAIAALLEGLQSKGAIKRNVVAKMVGGARMFSDYEDGSMGIGEQNVMSIRQVLSRERIPLIGQDVGGHHGRSIRFHLDSGKLIVKAIGRADREI